MLQQPELLAPAGSLETLKYAVLYGADAVYCALPQFGMRAAPPNLTDAELQEACIFAPRARPPSVSDAQHPAHQRGTRRPARSD